MLTRGFGVERDFGMLVFFRVYGSMWAALGFVWWCAQYRPVDTSVIFRRSGVMITNTMSPKSGHYCPVAVQKPRCTASPKTLLRNIL